MKTSPITLEGFVTRFADLTVQRDDIPFCFVLGAGASRSSGIRTGAEFVDLWLEAMCLEESGAPTIWREWAEREVLAELGLKWEERARGYPEIYARRYARLPQDAAAFFENEMLGREPSLGYAVLAYILANTANNIVVTTNFDNLIGQALQIYTHTWPLIVGHESLAGFARRRLRRPLVCKIHRDLDLSPFNERDSVSSLPVAWHTSLTNIFTQYTPIVIGYGGNDGSLINFLTGLQEPPPGGFYWCLRRHAGLDDRISELVQKLNGRFVLIEGFDELMLRLKAALNIPDLLALMESHHTARVSHYKRRFEELTSVADSAEAGQEEESLVEAAYAAVRQAAKSASWWGYYCKAKAEPQRFNRKRIYEQGIAAFPENHFLRGSFANFLTDVMQEHDEAEQSYLQALKLNPDCEYTNGNYAIFLETVRKDDAKAERHYRLAVEKNPQSGRSAFNYGLFLERRKRSTPEIANLYKIARANEPDNTEIRRVTERFFLKTTGAIRRTAE